MSLAIDKLPDDPVILKRVMAGREALIVQLLGELERLKRWRYGRSSESSDETLCPQLALDGVPASTETDPSPLATVTPLPTRMPAEDSTQEAAPPRPQRRRARALPAHLPRRTIVHRPGSCECPACGSTMRPLGEDVSEQLGYMPGYFEVIRHVRPKLSCGQCARIVQAPAPSRPIERGLPTAGLLAQVIASKYADHCPLYRQAGIYQRAGVELDRATLASWVGQVARLLDPLVASLSRYVLSAEKLHADDTPIPVLDPGRGRTQTGRIWTYVRDERPSAGPDPPAVWYRYSPDRKGEHPRAHLQPFRGILQADGYAGFGPLYGGAIIEAACWAHARRKYYDLYVADRSPIAAEAIRRIGLLYAIEREIRRQPAAVRQATRQERSAPVLADLQAWLSATLTTVSAKSPIAGAIQYTLVRWTALTRFRDDGRIDIDNSTAERSIRPLVLGRRNYLFAGSDRGGESAANLYSLIGTCRLNDIDPYHYLEYLLERIGERPINRIEALLPWHVAPGLDIPQRQAAA
jgi:transposase